MIQSRRFSAKENVVLTVDLEVDRLVFSLKLESIFGRDLASKAALGRQIRAGQAHVTHPRADRLQEKKGLVSCARR